MKLLNQKRVRMERKAILMNSIRIFCVAVFIFQFYLLTKDYLRYNVDKEVTNYIADEIELPEIHIYIPYYFAFDLDFLRIKYKSSFDQACRALSSKNDCDGFISNAGLFSKWLSHALTLSDIEKYSYPAETFINKIYWSESSENPLETGKCNIIRKASSTALVLIIRCLDPQGSPLKLSRAESVVFDSNVLLHFQLNTTVMLLRLIYPGKALIEDNSLARLVSTNKGKQSTPVIRFTKHTENLLPAPYKTMCKNYDRRQTFEDCLNANSIKQTGMLFPGTTVPFDKYGKTSDMHFNSPFEGKNGLLVQIYRNCQSTVTQQMCNAVHYSFTVTESSQDIAQDRQEMVLFFIATSEPDSITQSKPDFPLSDYLILSGSLFSTWFGISIMGQLLAASRLLCIPYRKSTNPFDFQTKTRFETIRTKRINKGRNSLTIIYNY